MDPWDADQREERCQSTVDACLMDGNGRTLVLQCVVLRTDTGTFYVKSGWLRLASARSAHVACVVVPERPPQWADLVSEEV
jgi:hypothetical protein